MLGYINVHCDMLGYDAIFWVHVVVYWGKGKLFDVVICFGMLFSLQDILNQQVWMQISKSFLLFTQPGQRGQPYKQ